METPDPVLEPVEIRAGRYRLRPPTLQQADDVSAMAKDTEIRMWNGLTSVTDGEAARAWCVRWSGWDGGTAPVWGVFDADGEGDGGADGGRLLGTISLFDIDMRNTSAEIGYRVAPWARGKGVGTAALQSVADWAFETLGLTRLQLLHGLEIRRPAGSRRRAGSCWRACCVPRIDTATASSTMSTCTRDSRATRPRTEPRRAGKRDPRADNRILINDAPTRARA